MNNNRANPKMSQIPLMVRKIQARSWKKFDCSVESCQLFIHVLEGKTPLFGRYIQLVD